MSDVTIKYKGATIATMDATGRKPLETSGKYCEGDIDVEYVKPAGPSGTKSISITQNGTVTEDVTNYASAEITVNVSGGGYDSYSRFVKDVDGVTTETFTKTYDFEQSIPILAAYLNKTDGYTIGRLYFVQVYDNTSTASSRVITGMLFKTDSSTQVSVSTFSAGAGVYTYSYTSGIVNINSRLGNIGAGSKFAVFHIDLA